LWAFCTCCWSSSLSISSWFQQTVLMSWGLLLSLIYSSFDSSSAVTSTFFWVYFHSLLWCKWACISTSHFTKLCSVSLEIVKVMTLAIVRDRARTHNIDNSEVRTVGMHRTSCSLERNNKQADLSAVQMQFRLITCWKYWCCCY
jgi:hypothetical protein